MVVLRLKWWPRHSLTIKRFTARWWESQKRKQKLGLSDVSLSLHEFLTHPVQPGVAAALEALAVTALVAADDLYVAFLHKEGAHGLVALPLAEHQVDVGFTTPPEDLHPQKARRHSRHPDHLLQVFLVSFYLVGVDLHPQVAQHAHRTPPCELSRSLCTTARPHTPRPRPSMVACLRNR